MTLATITLPDGTTIDYRDEGPWRSSDPRAADLATDAERAMPFAYRPDPIRGVAEAVAHELGGKVTFVIETEQPSDEDGPQ